MESAIEYSGIASEYGINVTYFVTGKAIEEEPELACLLSKRANVELAAHTYSALKFNRIEALLRRISKRRYNLAYIQKKDIRKTLNAFQEFSLKRPMSWRTHGYASDIDTLEILDGFGFKVISDEKDSFALGLGAIPGAKILSLPINVITDHEHLLHGPKCNLESNQWKGDCFGNTFLGPAQWLNKVVDDFALSQ